MQDTRKNGELVETYGPNTGSIAGVVLYSEGFVCLTGSWNLSETYLDYFNPYETMTTFNPKWYDFLTTGSGGVTNVPSSSFDFQFEGTEIIPTVTMFAHAEKGEFNHSNNPTFVEYGQREIHTTGAFYYIENDKMTIKNIVQADYNEEEPPFEKTTFISKVGIYDESKNLIAIAKLATPVRKREFDSITFKLKLDF